MYLPYDFSKESQSISLAGVQLFCPLQGTRLLLLLHSDKPVLKAGEVFSFFLSAFPSLFLLVAWM